MVEKRKYLFLFLKIAFSLLIFWLVFKKVVSEESLNLFSFLNLTLILTILTTGVIQVFLNAATQSQLLRIFDIRIRFSKIALYNFISTMYLLIIPGVFATDFYLAFRYGKEKKEYGKIIGTLVINRIIGFILFSLLALMGVIVLKNDILSAIRLETSFIGTHALKLGLGLIVIIIAAVFIFSKIISEYLLKIKNLVSEVCKKRKNAFSAVLLKLGFYSIGTAGRVILGALIGISMPIWKFVCIIFILNVLISLPVSLNGIGVREAGYVGLLTVYGIPGKTALSFALCEFGITLCVFFIGFLLWISTSVLKGKTLTNLPESIKKQVSQD